VAKRGRNEGSIYQQTDGRWVAAVSVGYRHGKRQRKRIYGTTRGAVADELKRVLSQQQDGLPIAIGRQTVGQFLTSWLKDSVKPSVRPATYRSYHQLVELHLKPGLGRYPLAKLSPQHVQRFLNDQLTEGRIRKPERARAEAEESPEPTLKTSGTTPPASLTPRTVQYLHAVLRRALNQATKWGLVPRNVATLVTPPRQVHREIQPLTPDQARDFLSAISGRRLHSLVAVSIACGLRQGEALGLKWSDVDLERKTIRLRQSLQVVDKQRQLVELKTERSRRTLALPEQIVSVLNPGDHLSWRYPACTNQAWQ
jgi:integrase